MAAPRSFERRVEDSMLDASRLGRYYLTVAGRWQKCHLILSAASVFGSLAAATVLLSPFENDYIDIVSAVAFLFVAATTTVLVIWDYSGRSRVARSACEEMNSIEVELRRLLYGEENAELIKNLEDRIDIANRNDLPVDDELNDRLNKEAKEVISSFYPSPEGGRASEAAPTG